MFTAPAQLGQQQTTPASPIIPAASPANGGFPPPATTLQDALNLAGAGYHVFPLVLDAKTPATANGFKAATQDEPSIRAMQWGGNIGIATGHDDLVVIDFDCTDKDLDRAGVLAAITASSVFANFKHWRDGLSRARGKAMGLSVTRSGGLHFYLCVEGCIPCTTDLFKTKASQGVAVDIRAAGGYVVAPPSVVQGGKYEWKKPDALAGLPVITAAEWSQFATAKAMSGISAPTGTMCGLGPIPAHARAASGANGLVIAPASDPETVRDALLATIAAKQGRGEGTTGRDFWLEVILLPLAGAVAKGELDRGAAKGIFDEACKAAGGSTADNEGQWASTVDGARDRVTGGESITGVGSIIYAAKAAGWVDPGAVAGAVASLANGGLSFGGGYPNGTDKHGKPKHSPDNAGYVLAQMGFGFSMNTRALRPVVCVPDTITQPGLDTGCNPISDATLRQLSSIASKQAGAVFPLRTVKEGILTLCDRDTFDPVVDYLEGLTWDGTPRLDKWLTTYCGVPDSGLHQQWARLTLIGAVARARRPGCKWDHVLSLIGAQGAGKSSVVSALAVHREWFYDGDLTGLKEQEIIEKTGGIWIMELSEMKAGQRRTVEHVKALISRQVDVARSAYGHFSARVPRSFVLIGTDNNDKLFADDTGNRRYWPVTVGRVDLTALKRDVEQLWAEADYQFKQEFGGDAARVQLAPVWYEEAGKVQASFKAEDPWESALANMLAKPGVAVPLGGSMMIWRELCTSKHGDCWELSPHDILKALGVTNPTSAHTRRLKPMMERLGWKRHQKKTCNVYVKPKADFDGVGDDRAVGDGV
jgi:Virulence-associated protein E/Bifunctional DNA primase/polymerase, N-terminal